jgi:hypothetical protein
MKAATVGMAGRRHFSASERAAPACGIVRLYLISNE